MLAAQFESFRDPFIILIALPTSMFGALLPLNLLGVMGLASMNIYSEIGLGDPHRAHLETRNPDGRSSRTAFRKNRAWAVAEAIEHAAGVRLRPILMTTAAMVVGMIPLIVAAGAGARSRIAIGLVIAAGMSVGTLFTLVRDACGLHADRARPSRQPDSPGGRRSACWKKGRLAAAA